MTRPDFAIMRQFWVELLRECGLPPAVRWVFYEDKARVRQPPGYTYPNAARFAFRPRPAPEAERIARFAYEHLDPKHPLAIVAYAVQDDWMITGFQGDLFLADEDIYREDWRCPRQVQPRGARGAN